MVARIRQPLHRRPVRTRRNRRTEPGVAEKSPDNRRGREEREQHEPALRQLLRHRERAREEDRTVRAVTDEHRKEEREIAHERNGHVRFRIRGRDAEPVEKRLHRTEQLRRLDERRGRFPFRRRPQQDAPAVFGHARLQLADKRFGNPAGHVRDGTRFGHQLLRRRKRDAVPELGEGGENRRLVGIGQLRHRLGNRAVKGVAVGFKRRETLARQLRGKRRDGSQIDALVEQFLRERRIEIAKRRVDRNLALERLGISLLPVDVVDKRKDLGNGQGRAGRLRSRQLEVGTGLENRPDRLLGVGGLALRRRDVGALGGCEVEMDDAQLAQLRQRVLLVGGDTEEIEMLHLNDHDATSCSVSGTRDLAILPRVTAAVCSSPSAILMTRIASLHCGIFTFSNRFTRWEVC